MIAQHNSKSTSEEIITTVDPLGASLRAKAVAFLLCHRSKWEATWAPDETTNVMMEGGKPAKTIDEFEQSLNRPKRWICGLCISAVAMIQHKSGQRCEMEEESSHEAWRRSW